MIPFADYCRQRGFSRQRGAQLRKAGRFGDALVSEPHGRTHRYFVTSAEAADEALEETAAGPRGRTSTSTIAPRPTRSKKRKRITDIKPENMTRGEAIDAKAIYDSEQSRVKAARLELDYDHADGKLILVGDAERQVDAWTARVVSMICAIPSRIAQAGVPPAVVAIVRREINRAREEVARGE